MAFVVEDGSGKSDATSYMAEADADAYFTDYGAPVGWTGATSDQKKTALILATQYLDAMYVGQWQGTRKYEVQALAWPRFSVVDFDGFDVDTASVPTDVQNAAAEAALRSLQGDTLMPDQASGSRSVTMEKVKAGPVERETRYAGTKSAFKKYSIIERLLRPYLRSMKTLSRA